MHAEGYRRQSNEPHQSLLRVGERLRESAESLDIREDDSSVCLVVWCLHLNGFVYGVLGICVG